MHTILRLSVPRSLPWLRGAEPHAVRDVRARAVPSISAAGGTVVLPPVASDNGMYIYIYI